MSKPSSNAGWQRLERGFTLIELMVSMALGLLLLAMTFYILQQLANTADLVGSMADVNENLRAGVNMTARDFATAGAEIPQGGIPIPNGGTATAIKRPGPGTNNLVGSFPTTYTTLPVITPGDSLGPTQGSGASLINTDIVNIISINQLSQLDQKPLTAVSHSVTAASITVNPTTCGWGSPASACPTGFVGTNSLIVPGQLIMLQQGTAYCLLAASAVNTTTGVVTFTHSDPTDVLGLNQFTGPTGGTINQLAGGTSPAVTAYHVSLVTYFLDTSTPRRLMRMVGPGCTSPTVTACPAASAAGPQPVALGISVLELSFSTSPASNPDPSDTIPSAGPCTPSPCPGPSNIRKVNLYMIAEADHRNQGTGQYYSKSIATSVVVQNLAYYNKY